VAGKASHIGSTTTQYLKTPQGLAFRSNPLPFKEQALWFLRNLILTLPSLVADLRAARWAPTWQKLE
jgi:hypothetical protein